MFLLNDLTTTYAYNSANQVIKQETPDAGVSRFWYDLQSRLVISQNAKQAPLNKHSYTKYDSLGRITEVGEKLNGNLALQDLPDYLPQSSYLSFLSSGTNSQLTQTFYDAKPPVGNGIPNILLKDNLRKRVTASIYRENDSDTSINASYYDYDLSGNVKTLYQQVHGLGVKKINYEYDLASGKVNFVAYQPGQFDQFYYAYKYDQENRLTEAWSGVEANMVPYGIGSKLNLATQKQDASYRYYLHGPLARVDLGPLGGKVQGLDYAYTLQGWLKGVNGNTLLPANDQGGDGNNGIAKDAMAYSLGYYPNDYMPIGSGSAYSMKWQPGGETGKALFNGNISNSTVAIKGINGDNPTGYTYAYDQLNRLTKMRQHDLSNSTTVWGGNGTEKYKENYTYDGNGNILTLQRNGSGGTLMDNLSYTYNKVNGKLQNNKLSQLKDDSNSSNQSGELLNGLRNYTYDAIGNLITDKYADTTSVIEWNVYGKIKKVTLRNNSVLDYTYDAAGNRVSKKLGTLTTWYVRDAQGNSLGVYDNAGSVTNWKEQQLYGSSRLGMWKPNFNLAKDSARVKWNSTGLKFFELNNHLGNVLAVISDKAINSIPEVVSGQDYYPFGMIQPGRSFSSAKYRYGFNGKENDNEVKGTGNQQDYGMRIYDPRIAKFLSVDPLTSKYPELTPYQFASNRPIDGIDLDGLEWYPAMKKDAKTGQYVPDNKTTLDMMHSQNAIISDFIRGGAKFMAATIGAILEIPLQVHQKGMSEPAKQNAFPLTYGQDFGTLALGAVEGPVRSIGDVIYYPEDAEKWGQLAATALLFRGTFKENISIYKLDASNRGFAYEKARGGNSPNNFPTIDRLYGREVTSIKSIDLTAKSYKNNSILYNTLRKYVDALDKFESGTSGGKLVTELDYSSKALDVGYQKGTASKAQLGVFERIKKYAEEKKIKVEFNQVK